VASIRAGLCCAFVFVVFVESMGAEVAGEVLQAGDKADAT
jgi:hypothetical protein